MEKDDRVTQWGKNTVKTMGCLWGIIILLFVAVFLGVWWLLYG